MAEETNTNTHFIYWLKTDYQMTDVPTDVRDHFTTLNKILFFYEQTHHPPVDVSQFFSLKQLWQRTVFSTTGVTTVYSGWPRHHGVPVDADSGAACLTSPGTACPPWSEPAHECRLPPQNTALKKISVCHWRKPRFPALTTWSLEQKVRHTFGVFSLLLLEARLQLPRVIVEAFERLTEDPILGLYSRVDILHGGIELVIRDASFHVPEVKQRSQTCHPISCINKVRCASVVRDIILTGEWSQTPEPLGTSSPSQRFCLASWRVPAWTIEALLPLSSWL